MFLIQHRCPMIVRAIVVWLIILACAFINGWVRVAVIIPSLGETSGHIISCITLSGLVLLTTWLFIRWIRPANSGEAIGTGVLWLVLTLIFESIAGHYLFGNSWGKLLADYNILRGRIWIVVLIVTAFAPIWMARLRRVFGSTPG